MRVRVRVRVLVCVINAGMPDRPASSQSGTGRTGKNNDAGTGPVPD